MNKAPIEHEELRAAIAELGGQKAVATRFGIPYRTVQNWYRGERTPPDYVARMITQFNETEKEKENMQERDRQDTKRYIEDQEALGWYNNELDKARAENAKLQKDFEWAMELADRRLREVEALDMEVCELREMVETLQRELEKQKKAREVWVRQAGMLTK